VYFIVLLILFGVSGMAKIDLSSKQLKQFVELFVMASNENLRQDGLAVVQLLKHLRPDEPELAMAEVWNLMGLRKLDEAKIILDGVLFLHPQHDLVKAMMALCLFKQGDVQWQFYANEVRTVDADEKSIGIINHIENLIHEMPAGMSAMQLALMVS
jgi:thioredoxin-like negative regulator of GroEL